jgi:uncharacterized protein YprB with RNaseH-like and TPR domain
VARADGDHWAVDALGAPRIGDRTEKQLISAFVGKIADLNPQLVTFNGNSFDLPVLRYRAMINAVSAGQTERLGRLEIDDQFELGRLQDRQIGRLGAVEDFAGIDASLTITVRVVGSVAHQPAGYVC